MPEGLLSRRLTLQRTAQTKAGMPLDSSSVSMLCAAIPGQFNCPQLHDIHIVVRSLGNASSLGNMR
jgi:hypothetical protein